MAEIKQDLLSLQYSSNFQIEGVEEVDINLELSTAPVTMSTVYGIVTDGTNPIPGATVKLFDSAGIPFKHALTDNDGSYSLTDIPEGTYSIASVAEGYRLSDAIGVTLTSGSAIKADLICIADSSLSLGSIAGVLLINNNEGVKTPLAGGKIILNNVNGDTLASTYAAADGEFVFYDVEDGEYTLISSADGYMPSSNMKVVIVNGSIANITMYMVEDARTYSGTVSGIIRNKTGQTVAGCFVGLYEIVAEGTTTIEKLVAVTKTNTAGKYLFGNVVGGNYIVKAKMNG